MFAWRAVRDFQDEPHLSVLRICENLCRVLLSPLVLARTMVKRKQLSIKDGQADNDAQNIVHGLDPRLPATAADATSAFVELRLSEPNWLLGPSLKLSQNLACIKNKCYKQ